VPPKPRSLNESGRIVIWSECVTFTVPPSVAVTVRLTVVGKAALLTAVRVTGVLAITFATEGLAVDKSEVGSLVVQGNQDASRSHQY